MDTENENEPPPAIKEAAEIASLNLLLEKSRKLYMTAYESFLQWKREKKANSFLVYFAELSTKYKPSTLWCYYSKLRSTINIQQGINIENYMKLQALLKRKSEGFPPKKAKTFSPDNINDFLTKASDDKYLTTKVALIMGIMGACRVNEIYCMKMNNLQGLGSAFLVNVPNTKTKITRKFTVTDNFYQICKKYISSRPSHITTNIFFLNYQDGKCMSQRIGLNKFNKMGKDIAIFLQLSNPEKFSGHSFRRSSATLLVHEGGDITALKRHGSWKSTAVAEGYIDDSIKNKTDTAKKISSSIQLNNTAYNTYQTNECNQIVNSIPLINLSNCANNTVDNTYQTYEFNQNVSTKKEY